MALSRIKRSTKTSYLVFLPASQAVKVAEPLPSKLSAQLAGKVFSVGATIGGIFTVPFFDFVTEYGVPADPPGKLLICSSALMGELGSGFCVCEKAFIENRNERIIKLLSIRPPACILSLELSRGHQKHFCRRWF